MVVPILLGGLVGLLVGFMLGFAPFGVWGGAIGAVVGVLAGGFIMTTLRRVARTDAPDTAGGTVEVAGTEFHPDDETRPSD